jgi:aryl-alcohol dehydrogenase-like predicted oxidoreductase
MTTTTAEKDANPLIPQIDRSRQVQSLASYCLLGRSGLRVSPISLGTANFGSSWGPHWSLSKDDAKGIIARYLEAGGNFLDTADNYNNGESEQLVGAIVRELTHRDRVVIATKFTFGTHPGDPNGGGNGRKHLMEAVDSSLRRLNTDYIDLYWVHNWDKFTPVEELMSSLNQLVQSGKVRYIGFSNPPAWLVGRAQTLAELRGWEKIIALQMQYSLAVRNIEHEYVDAAIEMGMGIVPWSPLANGLLTGKYTVSGGKVSGDGRVTKAFMADASMDATSSMMMRILDTLKSVAEELGRSPAQVALNWLAHQRGVVSSIIGASSLSQLETNIAALEFQIPTELLQKLSDASAISRPYPYNYHAGDYQEIVACGTTVSRTPDRYY